MKLISYQAKLTKEKEGGYSVSFPDVPGCFTEGETIEEALINAQEALSLHLEEAANPEWDVPRARDHKGGNLYWITPDLDVAIPLTIRQLRRDKKVSQTLLARHLDMTVQQYQKIEYPKKSNPTAKTLMAVCRQLGYEIEFKKKKKSA